MDPDTDNSKTFRPMRKSEYTHTSDDIMALALLLMGANNVVNG